MTTLYLDTTAVTRVLRDGPALRVRSRRHADRLFPFQRIGRIVSIGPLDWDTDALLAAAETGISVAFVSRNGELRAILHGPADHALVDLGRLLERLVCAPTNFEQNYRLWVHNQLRDACNTMLSKYRYARPGTDPETVERLVAERFRHHVVMKSWRRFRRRIHGLLRAAYAERLANLGLPPDAPALSVAAIHPGDDLAKVAFFHLLGQMVRFIRRQARRCKPGRIRLRMQHAVGFVERERQAIERQADALVRRLHLFLIEEGARYAA